MFDFPNPVNEYAARTVAAGVVVMAVAAITFQEPWILIPLAYGFWARVLTGPTLSPLGQLATRVVAPRLPWGPKLVPGPPKRFAQAIGVVFSTTAADPVVRLRAVHRHLGGGRTVGRARPPWSRSSGSASGAPPSAT